MIKRINSDTEVITNQAILESFTSTSNNNDSKRHNELLADDFVKIMEEDQNVIIDTRPMRKYNAGHVKGAYATNCNSRPMLIKAKKDIKHIKTLQPKRTTIIYNEDGSLNEYLENFIEFVCGEFPNVFILIGGYESFLKTGRSDFIAVKPSDEDKTAPDLTLDHSPEVLDTTMTEILPYLYIGNRLDASNLDMLQAKRITHILNVTQTVPFYHEKCFTYKRLSALDTVQQNIRDLYDEAISFVELSRTNNGKVLVHCWAGISRSTTIVSAYILKHTRLSVLDVVAVLKSKRSIIDPNLNFLSQLNRYYMDLEKNVETRNLTNPHIFKDFEDLVSKINKRED